MSDLSQSLVDAAAEAMASVAQDEIGWETDPVFWRAEAVQVVAAVLETLAAHTGPRKDMSVVSPRFLNHDEFVRLAAEIKEGS